MNLKEWESSLKTKGQIAETNNLFSKIMANNISNPTLYFEYLVVRTFLAFENYNTIQYGIKLNDKFLPLSVSPSGKPDLVVTFANFELVVEVTLRPISGKVDHFSHLDNNLAASAKQIGLLIVKDIEKIDDQIWNTYKTYFDQDHKLFMICDIGYLLALLNNQKNMLRDFSNFIQNAE